MELYPVRCRIPELLQKIGQNQEWLSEKTGIRKSRISEYVNLRIDNMSLKRAKLIAHYLKVHADELYDWGWRQE